MWLSQSSAYTGQWRTNYVFNTSAGPEVFFKLLDAQLNALLNPDYTDEEIRREVRNFGVTENRRSHAAARGEGLGLQRDDQLVVESVPPAVPDHAASSSTARSIRCRTTPAASRRASAR